MSATEVQKPQLVCPVPSTDPATALDNGDQMDQPEFHRRYGQRHDIPKAELINGTVFIMASPLHVQHSSPHSRLNHWLWTYADAHPEYGFDIHDNVSVNMGHKTEVQPDICARQTQGDDADTCIIKDGILHGAPSLIIEVANTSTTLDLGWRKDDYEKAGVREYVVYRSLDRAVDWFELKDGTFVPIAPNADGSLESRRYPGLVFPAALIGAPSQDPTSPLRSR